MKRLWSRRTIQQKIVAISITFACVLLLFGCDLTSRYGRITGVDQIAPRGQPAASSIIWSKTDPDKILVNGLEIGFGFRLNGSEVFVLEISSGQKKVIARADNEIIIGETWSPDDGRIVLHIPPSTKGYENYKGLWIWNVQSDSREFLRDSGIALWSPISETIAVFDSSDTDGLETLHLINVNTKDRKELIIGKTDSIGHVLGADWSPDEKQLVLSLGDPKSAIDINLFLYDVENQKLTRLSDGGSEYNPAWSPSKDKIAYINRAGGNDTDSIHIINADGSCDTKLPFIYWVQSLSWSPDGDKLAFVGPDGVYILDVKTFIEKNMGANSCLFP